MDPRLSSTPNYQPNFDIPVNREQRSNAVSHPSLQPKSDGIQGSVLDQVCVAVKSIGDFFIDLTQNAHEIHGNVEHYAGQMDKAKENINGTRQQILDRIKVIDKKCNSFFSRLFVNSKDLQLEKMKLELLDKKLGILEDRADDFNLEIGKGNFSNVYNSGSSNELKNLLVKLSSLDPKKNASIDNFLVKKLLVEAKSPEGPRKLYDALLSLDKDQRKKVIDHMMTNATADEKLELMEAVLTFEVRSENEDGLFRDSKVGMLLMAHFQEHEMRSFLDVQILPAIKDLQSDQQLFELNGNKVKMGGQQLAANQKAIQSKAQNVFDHVKEGILGQSMPPAAAKFYKSFYNLIKNEFEKRGHPNAAGVASKQVIASIFLRFINPALSTPKSSGLTDNAYNENQLRNVVYITKLLQNLANRVFSAKEPYMEFSKNFITANLPALDKMVEVLIK